MPKASRAKPSVKAPPKRAAKPGRNRPTSGRPTAGRVEAINKAVLLAARAHFLADGFESTLIDEIAATARVSKRTIYARYPTKDALRIAVIIEELARLAESHNNRLSPRSTSIKENLRRRARGMMTSLHSPEVRALDRLIGEWMDLPPELAKVLTDNQQSFVDTLTQEIQQSASAQPVPNAAASRAANHLMSALFGWHAMHNKIDRHSSLDDALAYADGVVDVLCRAREAW